MAILKTGSTVGGKVIATVDDIKDIDSRLKDIPKIVELSLDEYNRLTTKEPNVLYITY